MKGMGYLYIFGTILFTVYGQLILKWRIARYGSLPGNFQEKIHFFGSVLLDPFILSGLAAAVIASLFWIAAMTKFDLSFAYPFMSLSFVLVFFLSIWAFHEPMTLQKSIGLALIVAGVIISGRSL